MAAIMAYRVSTRSDGGEKEHLENYERAITVSIEEFEQTGVVRTVSESRCVSFFETATRAGIQEDKKDFRCGRLQFSSLHCCPN